MQGAATKIHFCENSLPKMGPIPNLSCLVQLISNKLGSGANDCFGDRPAKNDCSASSMNTEIKTIFSALRPVLVEMVLIYVHSWPVDLFSVKDKVPGRKLIKMAHL